MTRAADAASPPPVVVSADPALFADTCVELLARGGAVRFRAEGSSMAPAIRHGDVVTIAPIRPEAVRRGGIVLARRPGGLLVHRVVAVRRRADGRRDFVLRGDGKGGCDAPIDERDLLATVVAVTRNGRAIPVSGARARLRRIAGIAARFAVPLLRRPDRDPESLASPSSAAPLGDPPQRRLCRALTGPLTADTIADAAALWACAATDDVDVLFAARLLEAASPLPEDLRRRAEQRIADAQLRDLLRHRELCRISASFADSGIEFLLLKGAGLAATLYPEPHLRPSRDVDLLIDRASLDCAADALAQCGYRRMREPDGELARAQYHYVRADSQGLNHFVDLHWRVSDARAFGDALPFADAWGRSVPVPSVGPAARTLGDADALLLACIHRVAHHHDAPDLLWLWDIHLLAGRLAADECVRFIDRAGQARMRAVAARGLALAQDRFGTALPPEVLARLSQPGAMEPAARFIGGRARFLDVVRADLASVGRWGDRARLLREHLFPSRQYMRARYAGSPARLLPLAYLDRIVRGAPKWFRRRPDSLD